MAMGLHRLLYVLVYIHGLYKWSQVLLQLLVLIVIPVVNFLDILQRVQINNRTCPRLVLINTIVLSKTVSNIILQRTACQHRSMRRRRRLELDSMGNRSPPDRLSAGSMIRDFSLMSQTHSALRNLTLLGLFLLLLLGSRWAPPG